ncbi:MAG: ATP-binding protein [bacterium]|nr:ATP-binding protein [bacterium]
MADRPLTLGPKAELQILERFAISLLQQQTLDDLLWGMARTLGELMLLEDCVIYLVVDGELQQRAAFGIKNPDAREILGPISIPIGHGVTGTVAATGRAEIVADTRADSRYIADQFDGCSELAVPVIYQGEVLAVLDAESREAGRFHEGHKKQFMSCANIAAPRIAFAIEEQQRRQVESALQEANERLEVRVRQRTKALMEAVARLEDEARERERLQAEALRAQKLESLGLLAGGLAHDFNNLLQGILTHLEQIRLEHPSSRATSEFVDAAQTACLRARDLTAQLQTFARGGAPVREVHDLATILRETVEFCVRGSNITVAFDIAADLSPVSVDSTQISQVIQNLAINAVEAMVGGGRLWVAASNSEALPGGSITVTVRDEGPGIPAEHRNKVFDPYFTTKTEGTGLGLASAYGIIHRHGGRLTAGSAAGGGAVITLVLPVTVEDASVSGTITEPALPAMHVLLMDDDELVRVGTSSLLRRLGMRVTLARDGREAIERFESRIDSDDPVELAILDLTVPGGLGGVDALRAIHALDPELPAIVCSGYSQAGVMADPARYGFTGVLPKPFQVADLARVLADVVRR